VYKSKQQVVQKIGFCFTFIQRFLCRKKDKKTRELPYSNCIKTCSKKKIFLVEIAQYKFFSMNCKSIFSHASETNFQELAKVMELNKFRDFQLELV
jgi:hypothetical protein